MDSSGRKARVGFAFSSRILNVGGSQMGEWETSFHKKSPKTSKQLFRKKNRKEWQNAFWYNEADVKHCLAGYLSPPAINGYQAAIIQGGEVVYMGHV